MEQEIVGEHVVHELMTSLARCGFEENITDFILNEELFGPMGLEKIRDQMITLMAFKPGFSANPFRLYQGMKEANDKLKSVAENLEFRKSCIDMDDYYMQDYKIIHGDPRGSLNCSISSKSYVSIWNVRLRDAGYTYEFSDNIRSEILNSFFESDSEIIEEAQNIIIENKTKIQCLKKESIHSILDAFNHFDDFSSEILTGFNRLITTIKTRNTTFESLKLYLQDLCDKGLFVVFAETVVCELPHMVLSLTKDEWDTLVEWAFTNQAIVDWMRQMTNDGLLLPISTQRIMDHVNQMIRNRPELPKQFQLGVVRIDYVAWFLGFAHAFSKCKSHDLNAKHYSSNDLSVVLHFGLHELNRIGEYKNSWILPNQWNLEAMTKKMDNDILSKNEARTTFLYYEISRVAIDTRKTQEKVIFAVSTALHQRLGEKSLIHALSTELFHMIFCML